MNFLGRKILAVVAALAMCLVLAPAASAKLPPSGKYGCAIYVGYSTQYLGDLKVDGKRYKVNKSKWGTMADKGRHKSRDGFNVKFKTGAWSKLFKGFWERVDSVLNPGKKITEIELFDRKTGDQDAYCTLEKKA